jgi:GMP synthase (glutamine-hydrolysing)
VRVEFLVFQHVDCEPPGTYTPPLEQRAGSRTILLGRQPLPLLRPDELAGIVVMGGPMGAYETVQYPWLADEISFLATAAATDVPIFGVCLGSQLLAAALGAEAWPGAEPEVGVLEVELTDDGRADPVLGDLPGRFPALQWHGDTFSLPEGAAHLARSSAYPHQAFARGSAYGLQFHLEADWALAGEWLDIPAYRQALVEVLGPTGPDDLGEQLRRAEAELTAAATGVVERWLRTFVDARLR